MVVSLRPRFAAGMLCDGIGRGGAVHPNGGDASVGEDVRGFGLRGRERLPVYLGIVVDAKGNCATGHGD